MWGKRALKISGVEKGEKKEKLGGGRRFAYLVLCHFRTLEESFCDFSQCLWPL